MDADRPSGGDGLSWASAFDDLKRALTIAGVESSVGELWVAEGAYTPACPNGNRESTFRLVDGVAVLGGFSGSETESDQRDWVANETILSGDLNGNDQPGFMNNAENTHNVVGADGTDSTAILDGFTVEGGNTSGGPGIHSNGGAVFVFDGGATFANCTFADNWSTNQGGAMWVGGAGSPTVGLPLL